MWSNMTSLRGKTKHSQHSMVVLALGRGKVTARFMWDRAEKLVRRLSTRHDTAEAQRADAAEQLLSGNGIVVQTTSLGQCMVSSSSQLDVCLAELSCTCADSARHFSTCKHVRVVQASACGPCMACIWPRLTWSIQWRGIVTGGLYNLCGSTTISQPAC